MKNKKLNLYKSCYIIFFILFLLSFFIILYISKDNHKLTKTNTAQYNATLLKIEIFTKDNYCIINTVEYGDNVLIRRVNDLIDIRQLENFNKGDKVIFLIEKNYIKALNEDFAYVVELKISEKEIFTLDSYNKLLYKEMFQIKLTGIILGLIFLIISIYFIFMVKKYNNKKLQQE